MKTVKKEVKSGGKVVDTINIPVYGNLKEFVAALSEDKVLALGNRQYAADLTNEARAAKTRTVSASAQLNKVSKTNPELKAQIDALIKKYVPEVSAA